MSTQIGSLLLFLSTLDVAARTLLVFMLHSDDLSHTVAWNALGHRVRAGHNTARRHAGRAEDPMRHSAFEGGADEAGHDCTVAMQPCLFRELT